MKSKYIAFSILFIILSTSGIHAQNILFQKTYGGGLDDNATSVQQTADGGFVMVGNTKSFGSGNFDIYLVKTDSNGTEQWNKIFGGSGLEKGSSVQQTNDGGYIIAGSTASSGAGLSDFYLVKTDNKGVKQWEKTFGSAKQDFAYSVQQTKDGGFIVVGSTQKLFQGSYYFDVYLIKTDASGTKQWEKTYGGDIDDNGYSVRQTTDGGYVITGTTYSFGEGAGDIYLVKANMNGTEEWSKTFYLTAGAIDQGNSVKQTSDGGYIVAGYSNNPNTFDDDIYIIKTNDKGVAVWTKKFGGTGIDRANSIQQTNDGGYIIGGSTASSGAGASDVYVIKTDANGIADWTKTVGGTKDDFGMAIEQIKDGGYIIAGETRSSGFGGNDFFLVRIAGQTCKSIPAASINVSNTSICKGESITLTAVTNVTSATYSWSNNLTAKSITVNPVVSTTYSVKVIDSVGCNNTASKVITVKPTPPVPTISQNGSSLTSSAASGNQWYLNGNIIAGATSQVYNPVQNGNYTVTVTVNGCSATSTAFNYTGGTTAATPTITANGDTIFCDGDSVMLTSSMADSYLWSNMKTTQSIYVKNSGDYTVMATVNGKSATSAAKKIIVHPLPAKPTITKNGNTLTSTSASSYLWSNGATTQSINPVSNGNYTVTVKDVNGCSATSALFNFTLSGIAEQDVENRMVNIYPNPNNGKFNLEIASLPFASYYLKIYNVFGQVMYQCETQHPKFEIDFKGVPDGIYLIQIQAGEKVFNKKLVIEGTN